MSPRVVTRLLAAACAMWVGCPSRKPADPQGPRDRYSETPLLDIGIGKARFLLGEPINVAIVLENTTADYLWVNGRMRLDGSWTRPWDRDVNLTIVAPGGREMMFGCMVDGGRLSTEDYVLLRPGESLEKKLMLDCYNLSRPGIYKVTATYRDWNLAPPPAPVGAVHLEAELQSPTVTLEILPQIFPKTEDCEDEILHTKVNCEDLAGLRGQE